MQSVVAEKSETFAVRIVNLHRYLCEEKREFVLSKQLLRSGTSIGANAHEANYGYSKNEFAAKMSISLKEAVETQYWLRLLRKTEYITEEQYKSMNKDSEELVKLLTSIVKTSRS